MGHNCTQVPHVNRASTMLPTSRVPSRPGHSETHVSHQEGVCSTSRKRAAVIISRGWRYYAQSVLEEMMVDTATAWYLNEQGITASPPPYRFLLDVAESAAQEASAAHASVEMTRADVSHVGMGSMDHAWT